LAPFDPDAFCGLFKKVLDKHKDVGGPLSIGINCAYLRFKNTRCFAPGARTKIPTRKYQQEFTVYPSPGMFHPDKSFKRITRTGMVMAGVSVLPWLKNEKPGY
jgi:thioredoxin-related protein